MQANQRVADLNVAQKLDTCLVINGHVFEQVELDERSPLIRQRTLFIVEDIESGEVHIACYWNRGEGIRRIHFGVIGKTLREKHGDAFREKIRVWAARQQSYEWGKYHLETYLLPRLANKKLAEARATVQRRYYFEMSDKDKFDWERMYPYAVGMVLRRETDHQRRA
jgi:hypothetical protein